MVEMWQPLWINDIHVCKQASVFVQSHVRAHVELMWLLSSITPIGWLNRMIQFKEKSRKAVRLLLYAFLISIYNLFLIFPVYGFNFICWSFMDLYLLVFGQYKFFNPCFYFTSRLACIFSFIWVTYWCECY